MRTEIAYFQDGNIHVRQLDGGYSQDSSLWWCLSLLEALKAMPLEYRTIQDNQSILDLQAMFRARREWEEKNGNPDN